MAKKHHIIVLSVIMTAVMTLFCAPLAAQGNDVVQAYHDDTADELTPEEIKQRGKDIYKHNKPLGIRYTAKHPLIIVADWTFKPYTFVNDHGEPDGFQIEIFRSIFDKMHVPYEIRMMDWVKAKKEVQEGRAHLMMAIASPGFSQRVYYGKTVVGDYQMAVMHLKSSEHIRSLMLLNKKDTIHVKHFDYGDQYIKDTFGDSIPFNIGYTEPLEAQRDIMNGKKKYFIWGRSALKHIVRRYGLEDRVDVDPIDITAGKFRFASTDTVLLYELDVQLQHLKDKGEYGRIVNHWLVDNPVEDENRNFIEIIAIVAFLAIVVAVVFIITIVQRSNTTANLKEEFLTISRMAIDLTNCDVIAISVRKSWVYNVSGDLIPDEGISMRDYEQMIHPKDIRTEYEARRMVDSGNSDMPVVQFRMKRYNDATEQWRTMSVHAFVKKDRRNRPVYIYLVLIDETERMKEQRMLDRKLSGFSAITDISDIGMLYYDHTGRFVNCNRSLIRFFDKGGTGRAEGFIHRTTMQEMPVLLNGIKMEKDMNLWFCSPLEIPELNLRSNIEVRIRSVYDDKRTHRGYAIAIIDLDDTIKLKHSISRIGSELEQMSKDLERYKAELRFILQRNRMNTFRWVAGTDYLEMSHDLLSFDTKVPLAMYYDAIVADDKDAYEELVTNPSKFFSKPVSVVRKLSYDVDDSMARWYAINVIPEYDSSNRFCGAFGIRCDITDYMNSQENLRRETAKAEDSGRQKALFLANMTHELRTPLNAINGFAEIMQMFATPEEKSEYVNIMAHNCTMLIALIDNILQISMMDTDGIKIQNKGVDFAVTFPEEARKLEKYFTNPEVQYTVETPVESLFITIDVSKVMQILDAFVNNAAKFTRKGTVRVGYRYAKGMLSVYCSDTGCGIPEDQQQRVFERFVKLDDFVQGTGLGLSICKMIADNMDATIDVKSVEGEGTTVTLNVSTDAIKA